ncbi:hypothetical protein EU537_09515 [Candidatus Thorarchaeota archaeon]|nr:MAG: hypothetical protein EU537_09515 [Candidatus Thorarchaeota archaeon]
MKTKLELSRGLGKTLLVWSLGSFIVGLILFFTTFPIAQGIGLQAILWAVIDGVVASYTLFRQKDEPASKLARILKINTGLDIIYQVVGVLLVVFAGQNKFIVGNGLGIIVQGAFLFFLDLSYYRKFKPLVLEQVSSD